MIPIEVVIIAKEIALDQDGSEENYEDFMDLGSKIWYRIQREGNQRG